MMAKRLLLLLPLFLLPLVAMLGSGGEPVAVGTPKDTKFSCRIVDGRTVVDLVAAESIRNPTLFVGSQKVELPDIPPGWSFTYEVEGQQTSVRLEHADGTLEALCIK